MPSDMPYTGFEGLHIGNQTTCNIQGFMFTFGVAFEVSYFVMLLVYYCCVITLRMRNDTIRRYIEPVLHVIALSVGLAHSVPSVLWDLINPLVDKNWCSRSVLPFWCIDEPDTCIRGSAKQAEGAKRAVAVYYATQVLVAVICMVSIICAVYINERSTRQRRQMLVLVDNGIANSAGEPETMESRRVDANVNVPDLSLHENRQNEREEESRLHETKVIAVQIAAYFISMLIDSINIYLTITDPDRPSWAAYYHLITRPSHGLVNFFIFVGHKAYERRLVEETLSWNQAVWKVLMNKHESVFFFDNVKEVLNNSPDEGVQELGSQNEIDDILDPVRRPTPTIMPHLSNTSVDEVEHDQTTSLPPREDAGESLDSSALPSKNDGSSYGFYKFRKDAGSSNSGGGISVFLDE